MHKTLLLLFLLIPYLTFSQAEAAEVEEIEYDYDDISNAVENSYYEASDFYTDTIVYDKNTAYAKKRNFADNINSKYSGKEFEYVDNLKKEEKKIEEKEDVDTTNANIFLSFMANIFPYLLGLVVVLIILKSFVNTEGGLWKFRKSTKKESKKLVYDDDENIDENDYAKLLDNAINNNNFRLATRYYYLSLLKKLSQKELISYDKDKTNTEYQFELKNDDLRTKFSQLAYIYDYVWYGEFPVNQTKFITIERKYKTFLQNI